MARAARRRQRSGRYPHSENAMKAIAWLVMATVATVLVTGTAVAADNKELILGKWSPEEAKGKGFDITIEFAKDGVLKMSFNANGKNFDLSGKYKFTDDKTVEVTVSAPFAKEESKSEKMVIKSISGDDMVITDKDGKDQKFKKVK
jgi:uncharacterized protein (TIGR03066 family)